MKIAVIGAGIVGLCTAYELTQDGNEVTIFERNTSIAQEASFACGGNLSPSMSHPLAFPGWPQASRLRNLLAPGFVTLHKGLSFGDVKWLYGWKKGNDVYLEKLAAAHALATYSLTRMHTLSANEMLNHEQAQGHLLLWPTESGFAMFHERLLAMKEWGQAFQVLTPEEARATEPALQADFAFHAATYLPADEVGNCRQFAHLLKDKLIEAGVQLHFETAVETISSTTAGVQFQTANGESHACDQIVICAGTGAFHLLKNERPLPLTTIWSHSLSTPIREPLNAPRSSVQDARTQMTISRLGNRVRVTGGAALGAQRAGNNAKTVAHLYRTLNTLFPGAADFSRSAQIWKGASQFTPDGLPVVGQANTPGVWLNLGHGHNGWSMACGCARLLADLIQGKPNDMDASKFQASRFST